MGELGGQEAVEVDDRARRAEAAPYGARLTAREIRGLLTRIGAELAKAAGEREGPRICGEEARQIRPREFVERMTPFLRMN